ncbi:MAG: septation ring formation regulator EzrA [bacterium]|nr:septation ring formation regulator EzrA [bacterium]
MNGVYLLIVTFIIIAVILITVVLVLMQKHKEKVIRDELEQLDREKNLIASTPVLSELSKVEPIIKNDKMEEKYKNWHRRFELIRDYKITQINDMIIDIDLVATSKNYSLVRKKLAKAEIEIYKARESAEELLTEIKEITISEEKYRTIVTKLKVKYRSLVKEFHNHQDDYDDIVPVIDLQFENIEKRFLDFEQFMEKNEYDEVVHIVKTLDTMIDHMSIVILEVPNLVLLTNKLIPRRIEEIEVTYRDMSQKGYPLDYLKIEYNMEEARKNVNHIMDRIKVLNLEDCMFELKTILDYLDSIFNDFEKERFARKVYEEDSLLFSKRLKRSIKIIKDIYAQITDIKTMYDLKDSDIDTLNKIGAALNAIKSSYKDLIVSLDEKDKPYSVCAREIGDLIIQLKQLDEELDFSLRSLGSMHDDEVRAREQLDDIQELLKQCKLRIRSYKLPIIMNNYFIELAEANEAILEIIKELEKKPIVIKVLNTRVDTARDLVLKLYNTTNDMIKTAQLAEMVIVYGNRFRSSVREIDLGLTNAEMLFHKGDYKDALEISLSSIEIVDPDIHKKILKQKKEI